MKQKSPLQRLVVGEVQGHPPGDVEALLRRGEDSHRHGRLARRTVDCRAVPPRRHCRGPLLQLVKEFLEAGRPDELDQIASKNVSFGSSASARPMTNNAKHPLFRAPVPSTV
jgi:hypothetical protein